MNRSYEGSLSPASSEREFEAGERGDKVAEVRGRANGLPFTFPDGILGFPSCRRFVLEPDEAQGFYWLHSVDCETLAFLLVDPFRAIDGFFVDLGDTDLHHLQTTQVPEIGVMAIVTLPRRAGDTPTANLQGVVAFNFPRRIGRQVIIQDSPFNTRWPLDLQRLAMAS